MNTRATLPAFFGAVLFGIGGIAFGQTNPVLVVGTTANPFSGYYSEILKAEGFNGASYADLTSVNASVLASRDVVILGETPLTAAQVNMFADWVTGGGKLIAMRPDKQLAGLLGLAASVNTLSNGYLLINTAQAPGAGLVSQTIQYHGTADLYSLSGASALATLYSTASAATSSPAVTLRNVGVLGGQAAAFTYDLARSVVYTRQGNPAWAGIDRDGQAPIRSNDMFFGADSSDPQPDWIDLSKVAIPQADEQQRLLANMILQMNLNKKPLPRFWYFPFGKKAAVVLTGDDHANGGTIGRFDSHIAASPAGCVVDNWECIRSSSYIFTDTAISASTALTYHNLGFELGLHVNTGCADYTPSTLPSFYSTQLNEFRAKYTTIPSPKTNRTHCIAFSDWSTQPAVELANGIRLDTNYYYWPPEWVNDTPGFMTGSGMVMRFANMDGSTLNIYQSPTQMTDESGQSYPFTPNTLLDRALGPEGYYGFFDANIHTDQASGPLQVMSDAVVASAKARGVPVISAAQLLRWLDGRDGSSFSNYTWNGAALGFNISLATGSNGAEVMVPFASATGTVSSVTIGGTARTYRTETIKGIQYAIFRAAAGLCAVNYTSAAVSVSISPQTAVLSAAQFQNFTGTVVGAANTAVTWSVTPSIGTLLPIDSTTARYTAPSTIAAIANVTVTATSVQDPTRSASAVVTLMPSGVPGAPSLVDTTTADFTAGTLAGASIAEREDGEVQAQPAVATDFSGAALPAGWTSTQWSPEGTSTVSGGAVTVDASRLGTDAVFAPGRVLEFSARFSTEGFQHAGLGVDFAAPPWAIFSTGAGGSLLVRTNDGSTSLETDIGPSYLGTMRTYRIQWNAGSVVYFVDGVQVASHSIAIGALMRPLASDYIAGGTGVSINWLQLTPHTYPATFTSRVLDGSAATSWGAFAWTADAPAGTSISMRVRTGDTAVPDGSWTSFASIANGGTVGAVSRYIQYEAQFASSNPDASTLLRNVTVNMNSFLSAISSGNVTGSGATITWTTSAPADTQVDYGLTAAYGQSTVLDPALVTNHSVALSGLTANTLYHFRVKSRDGQGNLHTSADFTFTTSPQSGPVITSVQGAGGGSTATITWLTDRVSDSRVDYGTSPSSLPFVATGASNVTNHSVTLTGLTVGTTYYYRVSSADTFGSSTSPQPPAAPLSFTVVDNVPPVISGIAVTPGLNSASVTWTTNEASNSRVNYGTSPSALNLTAFVGTMVTSHTVALSGLTSNTPYYYTVVSADALGNTATSPNPPAAPLTFTTLDPAPPVISGVYVVPSLLGRATVRWTTNKPASSRIDYGVSESSLPLNVSDAVQKTSHSLTLTGLGQGQKYYFRLTSADLLSNTTVYPAVGQPPASFTETALSLWNASATPDILADPDNSAIELGVKFVAQTAGSVAGVAFYKGSGNTGTHTGSLWAADGSLLATGTFTNETATGWQQLLFATPVPISANTTYTVSYHAPVGRYSVNENYFASATVNGPLTAPSTGSSGGNGVYLYGASAFPSNTYAGSNYWVDVIFLDTAAPLISGVSAAPASSSANVTWLTNEAANAQVLYGTSASNLNLSAAVSTFGVAQNVVLTGLASNTTYHYRVVSADTSGNQSIFPVAPAAPLTFQTTAFVPMTISNVAATTGSTAAIVTWTTNLLSNSRVDYGTSPSNLNLFVTDAANVTAHAVSITGLSPSTTYYYRVRSTEPGGTSLTSPASPAAPLSFLTSGSSSGGGVPPSQWDITGAGDPDIQGFTTDISYNLGETVRFKIKTTASSYRLDIYRMGYYGGNGAALIATVNPSVPLPQSQPNCLTQSSTGLVDCGNWAESAQWTIPTNAKSGIYFAKLVGQSSGVDSSHVVFVVRNDASTSAIVFQTSDTTWQAYNAYGGNSLYVGSPAGRAYKVSYNRPFTTRDNAPEDWVFNAEYPMIRWLEANGYDVTYIAGIDTDRRGNLLTNHKIFMSVGHDEYWSGAQRANVEAARAAGVHLAFFSGNEVFWKTRYENSISSPATAYRTLVCYKETHADAKIDPTSTWTGTWRDPRFSPPSDGGRPENELTGTIFTVNCCTYAMTVPEPYGKLRFWRNTSIATLAPGQVATLPDGTLGYEWDEALDNGFSPPSLFKLSSTTVGGVDRILDYGTNYGPGTSTHSLTLYKHTSGAWVFGAGTVQWSWGLDSEHDRGGGPADVRMQQATVNLLADMGVQPTTLQAGLLPATASTDTTAPVATITFPAAGPVAGNTPISITGGASDVGGQVAAVEVSVDAGVSWRPATGQTSWSYVWNTPASGSATILVRAVDDSGNRQTPPASVNVTFTVTAPSCNPCSIWPTTVPGVTSDPDNSPVELGLKFRSSVAGQVTGVRFYKGAGNTGVHTGRLWSASGSQLASVTFTGETASGWQQMLFSAPVAITPNTTYVVSYFAPVGRYAADTGYFATQSVTTGPLTALQDGTDGPNGVYRYSSSGFPTDSWQSTNYYVDVLFVPQPPEADTTPPVISGVTASPSGTQAVIAWNTDEPASGVVNYGTSAGSLTSSQSSPTLTTSKSVTITGLTPGTTYYFRVTATDAATNAATSPAPPAAPASFVLGDTTPPVISGLTATPSGTTAVIAWTTNEAASGVVNYGTSSSNLNLSQSSATLTTSKSITLTGLTAGATYFFRVTATDAAANAATSPAPPAAPASFALTDTTPPAVSSIQAAPGSTTAVISWSTNEPASGRVNYGTSSGNLNSNQTSSTFTTSKSITLTGLNPGVTYFYRIVATDAAGNATTVPATSSSPSSFATVWGLPSSVSVVTGNAAGGNAASLASDDNNYFQVSSTTSGITRTASWTGIIANVPRSTSALRLNYRGNASATCSQSIAIFNYNSNSWTTLDSGSIGTSETTESNLAPPGTQSNYVSGSGSTGNVQFRLTCTRTLANFTHRGEFVRLSY